MKRLGISMVALLGCAVLAGCVSTTPYLDDQHGASATLSAQQTLDPDASRNTNPVKGLDGKAAKGALDNYRDSFRLPPSEPRTSAGEMGAERNHRMSTGVNMARAATASRNQRGVVAIIVGLTLAVLIGFVGLALDLGRLCQQVGVAERGRCLRPGRGARTCDPAAGACPAISGRRRGPACSSPAATTRTFRTGAQRSLPTMSVQHRTGAQQQLSVAAAGADPASKYAMRIASGRHRALVYGCARCRCPIGIRHGGGHAGAVTGQLRNSAGDVFEGPGHWGATVRTECRAVVQLALQRRWRHLRKLQLDRFHAPERRRK